MDDDFQLIDPARFQVQFHFRSDAEGNRTYSTGISGNSPGPMVVVGVYALIPQGIPVCDFQLMGMGQAFQPPPPDNTVPVFLVCDSEGFWGHLCPRCKSYFRNKIHPAIYPLSCPYCGLKTNAAQYLSGPYRQYIADFTSQILDGWDQPMDPNSERTVEIDIGAIARDASEGELPELHFASESQQTKINCSKCDDTTDILGKYGYCASCGYRTIFRVQNWRWRTPAQD